MTTAAQEQNLKVVTDHLTKLAHRQQVAATVISEAGAAVRSGVGGDVLRTHGVVCGLTSAALAQVESLRTAASGRQHKLSEHLGESLKHAADNYNNVDYREGRTIGACSV